MHVVRQRNDNAKDSEQDVLVNLWPFSLSFSIGKCSGMKTNDDSECLVVRA